MDTRSWLECNMEGLEFFGGVPKRLVLDNLKGGVLKPDMYEPQLNRAYEELAAHYGVVIDPCRKGKAKNKPRVERLVPYVRESSFTGRTFSSPGEIDREALRWCAEVAGMRVHGRTGQRSLEVFNLVEKPTLEPPRERRDRRVADRQGLTGFSPHGETCGLFGSLAVYGARAFREDHR